MPKQTVDTPSLILSKIHKQVISRFKYISDEEQQGMVEHWQFPVEEGLILDDCDGFAIACRKLVKDLTHYDTRLILCTTEDGEYHLVCAVGDFILDNRFPFPTRKDILERLGYNFKYCSGLHAGEFWNIL